MDQETIKTMARELATLVNRLVNIPFMKEDEEQIVLELILLKALQLVMGKGISKLAN